MQISYHTLSRAAAVLLAGYLLIAAYHIYRWIGFDGVILGALFMWLAWVMSYRASTGRLLLLIVVAGALSITWGVVAEVVMVWDFSRFYEYAQRFGWDADWKWVALSKTPITIIIYGSAFKLLNVSLYSTYIIGAFLWGAQSLVLYRICAALGFTDRAAFLSAALYLMIPSTILFAPVISSESTFLLFMLLAVYGFIHMLRADDSKLLWYAFLTGACFGLLHLSRTLGGLYMAITMAVLLVHWLHHRRYRIVPVLAAMFAGFLVAVSPKVYANYQLTGDVAISSHPATWFLVATGTNRATEGRYSTEDWKQLGFASGDMEVANARARAAVKERVLGDPVGFIRFALGKKMRVLWAKDDAGWWKSTGGSVHREAMTDSGLRGLLLKIGDSYHFMLVVLAVVGLALYLRRQHVSETFLWPFMLVCAFCLATGFLHLFIEVQSRYHYPFMPLASVMSAIMLSLISGTPFEKGGRTNEPGS